MPEEPIIPTAELEVPESETPETPEQEAPVVETPPEEQPAEEPEIQADEDPPFRSKEKKDFIIERLLKKNQKLEAKATPQEAPAEDEYIDPDEEARISSVVNKIVAPVLGEYEARAAETERKETEMAVDKELEAFPELKGYREKILNYANHPSRAHLPVSAIIYEVAGQKLLEIGAQRAREADKKANESSGGGGSARSLAPGQSDYSKMSNEEFEKEKAGVMSKNQ